MPIKIKTLAFFITLLLPVLVFGQYDEIRFPQSKEEIAKMRTLKVLLERKYLIDGKKQTLYSEREFDSMGYLIRLTTVHNHQHFTYDEKHRLTAFIDSALAGEEYIRVDDEFEYDNEGHLSFARLSPNSLTFKYYPETKILFESTMIDYEQYRRRYFYYDKSGRFVEEQWFYWNGNKEQVRKITYDSRGNLSQELIWKYFLNNGSDSDIITYRYDDKNRMIEQKQISTSVSPKTATAEDSFPKGKIIEVDTTIYQYGYNINGNRGVERFHYSNPGYDHKYEWWYNKIGLKNEENYYGDKGELKNKYLYKYVFRETPNPEQPGKKKGGK